MGRELSHHSLKLFRTLKQETSESTTCVAKQQPLPSQSLVDQTMTTLQDQLRSGHTMEKQTAESLISRVVPTSFMTSTWEQNIMVRRQCLHYKERHRKTTSIWAPVKPTDNFSHPQEPPIRSNHARCMRYNHERRSTIPAYSKSVSVCLNMRPGQTLSFNSKLSFFQPSRTCLKLRLTLEATPLIEVSSRAVCMCCSTTVWPKTSTFPKPVTWDGSSTRLSMTLN